MSILVTGGTGFIRSHTVHRLVSLGHRMTVFDNEPNGLRSDVPTEVRYIRDGVTNPADLVRAFAERPEAAVHIAGQVSMGADPHRRRQADPRFRPYRPYRIRLGRLARQPGQLWEDLHPGQRALRESDVENGMAERAMA